MREYYSPPGNLQIKNLTKQTKVPKQPNLLNATRKCAFLALKVHWLRMNSSKAAITSKNSFFSSKQQRATCNLYMSRWLATEHDFLKLCNYNSRILCTYFSFFSCSPSISICSLLLLFCPSPQFTTRILSESSKISSNLPRRNIPFHLNPLQPFF